MSVRRVLTPRWLLVHAVALVLVIGFLLLCWWQVTRAASGNLLSFGYAIEWPVFSGFVVFVWLREVRKAIGGEADAEAAALPPAGSAAPVPSRRRRRSEAAYDDRDDPELAAYNHYLAWLNANPDRSPAAYPGVPVNQGETL